MVFKVSLSYMILRSDLMKETSKEDDQKRPH